jgi:hypothetical protein
VRRAHGDTEDEARRFNRTENVRPIPPADPDFARLFGRRNDAESINRALHGDGKVITPLYRARPGATRVGAGPGRPGLLPAR